MKYDKLSIAFQKLEQAAYFARQSFWCCQSCGWDAVPESYADKAAFYHKQDADALAENRGAYLCWSGDGEFICKTLSDAGVRVDWDGDKSRRIHIQV